MPRFTIHIKNMVCPRCIKVVTEELKHAGFNVTDVALGIAIIEQDSVDMPLISSVLLANGFELLEEKTAKLINEIKLFIIVLIRSGKLSSNKLKMSTLLEQHFHKDYGHLSQVFSQAENNTIEKFIIHQKIELVKEWLIYDEKTLAEIAAELSYSSTAHLSNQFKQVTGFPASEFKKLKSHHRKTIDTL
jgi:AraC family transcriptional regulator